MKEEEEGDRKEGKAALGESTFDLGSDGKEWRGRWEVRVRSHADLHTISQARTRALLKGARSIGSSIPHDAVLLFAFV